MAGSAGAWLGRRGGRGVRVAAGWALCLGVAGCYPDGGGGPVTSIAMQPRVTVLAVGATQQFTATITNSQGHMAHWNLFQPFVYASPLAPAVSNTGLGTITQTGLYVAPASSPTFDYGGAPGLQGMTGVNVTAQTVSGQTITTNAGDGQQIVITEPAIRAGFVNPAAVTVALGGTYKFQPYAVGGLDRSYGLQVQGATGGSTAYGTIVQDSVNAGLYTAPAVMPMTGPAVVVTVVSVADGSKTASVAVTLK